MVTPSVLPVPIQFVLSTFFGMIAGIVIDFLSSIARAYHDDSLRVEPGSLFLFVFSICFFIGILAGSLILQDKIIDFKQRRITFIASVVIGALFLGYFFPAIAATR